jgi:hypothetical protein
VKTPTPAAAKRIVAIVDEAEIASIEANGLRDLIGWCDSAGHYYAYADSAEKYRARKAKLHSEPGANRGT